jgi:hypothetical protein
MIPVYVRSQSEYTSAPVAAQEGLGTTAAAGGTPTGLPNINATIRNGSAGAADTITFLDLPQVASEGAFVIIADARGTGSGPNFDTVVAPDLQGRIYRLGNRAQGPGTGANTWELMPGYDFETLWYDEDGDPTSSQPNTRNGKEYPVEAMTDVLVFVVGRGVAGEATAQEVAAYTTFVTVN